MRFAILILVVYISLISVPWVSAHYHHSKGEVLFVVVRTVLRNHEIPQAILFQNTKIGCEDAVRYHHHMPSRSADRTSRMPLERKRVAWYDHGQRIFAALGSLLNRAKMEAPNSTNIIEQLGEFKTTAIHYLLRYQSHLLSLWQVTKESHSSIWFPLIGMYGYYIHSPTMQRRDNQQQKEEDKSKILKSFGGTKQWVEMPCDLAKHCEICNNFSNGLRMDSPHRNICTWTTEVTNKHDQNEFKQHRRLKLFQQQTLTSKMNVHKEVEYALVAEMLQELDVYIQIMSTAMLSLSQIAVAILLIQTQANSLINASKHESLTPVKFLPLVKNYYCDNHINFIFGYNNFRLSANSTSVRVYTVAKYPDNHNHLLPLKLIKKLDAMSPQEFVKYVLEELTLEERESLMVDEKQRRKTFQVGWPYDGNLSGIKLAQAGFYSVNDYDRVQCVFCRGSLHRWERDDVPMLEHARSFNFCRFVKGLSCGNIEYRSEKLTKEDMKNITKFKDTNISRYDSRSDMIDSSVLGISTNRAAMIEYAVNESRLKTYSRWPKTSPMTPKVLCGAGFYFTGFDDMVRCFYCAGAIREWSTTDDPYVEHARWFPDCAYLIQQKSVEFVDHVHATTPANKKSVRQTKAEKIAVKKADKAQTTLEDMIETCISLGKTRESIKQAIEINGGPFDNIREMIDVIYETDESDGVLPVPRKQKPKEVVARIPTDSHDGNYDSVMPRISDGTTAQSVGLFNCTDREQKFQLGCRRCETRTGQYVPATHIGLPCGHVNFCSRCNEFEEKKATEPNYKVRCAHTKCQAPLTGTMRIYLA